MFKSMLKLFGLTAVLSYLLRSAVSNIVNLASSSLFIDTDCANAAVAVKASSGIIYELEIDNTGNAAASYVKIWNTAAGSVTVGTTAPDYIFMVPASVKRSIVIPDGLTLGTAIAVACVTGAGTAGSTSPTSDVTVKIVYV